MSKTHRFIRKAAIQIKQNSLNVTERIPWIFFPLDSMGGLSQAIRKSKKTLCHLKCKLAFLIYHNIGFRISVIKNGLNYISKNRKLAKKPYNGSEDLMLHQKCTQPHRLCGLDFVSIGSIWTSNFRTVNFFIIFLFLV